MAARTHISTTFPLLTCDASSSRARSCWLSSAHKGETNIMTMGWHMIMEFEPSLVGCSSPTDTLNVVSHKVVGIGNCSGRDTDKFAKFALTQ